MIRKNPVTWVGLSDCRENHKADGRFATFEIDSGYALCVTSHSTTFYTGTTCQAKKLGDKLNNLARPTLWLYCTGYKSACLIARTVKCKRIAAGYRHRSIKRTRPLA